VSTLSHVEFYVADAMTQAAAFRRLYGFEAVAVSEAPEESDHFSVVLRQGAIVLILTEARSAAHPAASYVESHGDGVADIALRVPDARVAHAEAVRRGAEPWAGGGPTIHGSAT
jgi:4-hydroxymandelate synthase